MREHRKGPDRRFSHAPAHRADERETERVPERKPNEVVSELLAGAEQALATLAEVWIPKLEAAQATEGDRRRPYQRRAEYDLAVEGIAAQFRSAARTRERAVAHANQHTLDATAMLEDFDQKVEGARKQVKDAPKAPARFERVPGEAAIARTIAMPPGAERNTELALLFSELDKPSARVLHRRLEPDEPDQEDELANAFHRVTTARKDLLGILAGTRKVRIDPRTFTRRRQAEGPGSFVGAPVPRERGAATQSIPAAPADSKAAGKLAATQSPAAPPALQRKSAMSGQRSPSSSTTSGSHIPPVPARGDYLVERTPDGSYVFVFNTFDRRSWSEPVFIGLRYYMQQAFPGVGDAVIRTVFTDLKVKFEQHDSAALPDDHRYELQIDVKLHRNVVAWMAAHHPEWAPHAPKLGGGGLHQRDAGGDGKGAAHGATPNEANPSGTTMTSAKDGDSAGALGGHAGGKLGGGEAGTKDGDVRTTRDGGIKDGSIYGEPGGDAHGWHRWAPKGQLQLRPTQPTYVTGSSVQVELAWDLSVHPEAGQILLPNHCTYAWTVHRGGKLIDSDGRSVLADDRRASLHLGQEPGMYEISVTATSRHFKAARQCFSSSVVVRAVSEQAFDRAAFDDTQLTGQDAAFSRDEQGALHLKAGQVARTPQEEIGSLDVTRGGIDALAAQAKIMGSDHDVAVGQLDKQRAALVEIQAKVKGGTPYVVRGSFVSREDSSTTPLRLLMHVLRRSESGGVARYELILHDTTFGEAVQHPGSSAWRLDHDAPAAVYRRLEGEALDEVAGHFHAHNDYPRGTVHLAAQRLASDAIWEKTLDTDNGRKTAKKILGTAALIGGAAMLIVPGGSVVATGLMVVTSTAGVAAVALELEDRLAKEGHLKLDRRLAMDVLQVVAISLPFGTLTRTFAAASLVGKGRFLLCMTGLDIAQGFVIASDVKEQLRVIEANTAVELAGAVSDEQRTAIHGERDRRVAEVIGGAVTTGAFMLVSMGGGLKHVVATSRGGRSLHVREPVAQLGKGPRAAMEQALADGVFANGEEHVAITPEERLYLEHQVAAPQPKPAADATAPADSHAKAPSADESGQPLHEPTTQESLKAVNPNVEPDTGVTGVTFQGRGDRIGALAKKLAPEGDYFDVVVHGDGKNFAVLHDGQWVKIKPNSVRKYIRAQKGYRGQPIRLLSCEAGAEGAMTAQAIADGMNVHVKAPTEKIWLSRDKATGEVDLLIGNDPSKPSGGWTDFEPHGAKGKAPAESKVPAGESTLPSPERPSDHIPAQSDPTTDDHAATRDEGRHELVSLGKPIEPVPPKDATLIKAQSDEHVERVRDKTVEGASEAVTNHIKEAAYKKAEETYQQSVSQQRKPQDARKDASEAAKAVAETEWLTARESITRDAADKAIDDGSVFDRSQMSEGAKRQLDAYRKGESKDGGHAKRLATALPGNTIAVMEGMLDAEVAAGNCRRADEPAVGPAGIPQLQPAYYFNDGSVIRLKPQGDQHNKWWPSFSVEVKNVGVPAVAATKQADIAFKVDNRGRAVPKDGTEIANPYRSGKYPWQRGRFNNLIIYAGHQLAP